MDNIETEGTGIVSSIGRVCDTDLSHQSRTNDLDLAKIPKAFTELNSRRMNYRIRRNFRGMKFSLNSK